MFLWILLGIVATSVIASVIYTATDTGRFVEVLGAAGASFFFTVTLAALIWIVTGIFISTSPSNDRIQTNSVTYTIADNSKFEINNGNLEFTYLKDGHLESFKDRVDQVSYNGTSRKTVDIESQDVYLRGFSPLAMRTEKIVTVH